MTRPAKPIPDGYNTITPQLTLDNAAQTIDWYVKALGAEEIGRMAGPDGKIMHAELRFGNSRVFLHDVMVGKGPRELGGSPASLYLLVEDSDALFTRAVGAGAAVQVPLADQFWGHRAGAVTDPAGYTWWIATQTEELTDAEVQQRAEAAFASMAPSAP